MADPNSQPEKPNDDSLIGGIIKDCFESILVPKSKELLTNLLVDGVYACADFVSNVAQRRVWKDRSPIPPRNPNSNQSRTPYASRYEQTRNGQASKPMPQPTMQNPGTRSSTKIAYVFLKDQFKADSLKNDLINKIRQFGRVTVAEFYQAYNDLLEPGVDPNDPTKKTEVKLLNPIFTDFSYGWSKVEDIHYVRNRDGYWFNLPVPTQVIKS